MAKSNFVYDIIDFNLVLFQGLEVGLTVYVQGDAGSIPASGDDSPVKPPYSTVRPVLYTVRFRTVRKMCDVKFAFRKDRFIS